MEIKIKKIAHHRNGVGGNGFYVVLFSWKEEGTHKRNMQGIIFNGRGNCAILDVDEMVKCNIDFAMGNSWRGDHFESDLRKAIKEYELEQDKIFRNSLKVE
jgi:hypothetical protein